MKFEHLDGFDSEGTWAISYGDLLTLITSFFIMFFTADKFYKNKYPDQVPFQLSSHISPAQQ
ncbi:MAG: flagellar motor protein MotB, partial [Pseudobdellovibrionaceae bacterium]|nr:flagellar motor protein MotB [Pseudobdellovibrionaceae bacterium]